MELKKLSLFAKRYKFILAFAILTALAAGVFSYFSGAKYNVSVAFMVSRLGAQQAADYKYDNYYALKATNEFGDTIAGWFKTPDTALAIYKRAKINSSGQSLNGLARHFKAIKLSPSAVEIRFSAKGEEEAKSLAEAVVQAVPEKVNLLNVISWQGIAFAAVAGEPVIIKNSLALWFNVLAGFFIGLVVGMFIAAAKEYLK